MAQSLARRHEATSSYKGILDERGNALLSVSERAGPRSNVYLKLEDKLRRDEEQLSRIFSSVRRPISRWSVRPMVLIMVAFGLALLEAPANKFLFDVALQSSGIVSYAVSAGVTAFLLFLAHFAGRSARQVWSDYRSKVIWSNIIVFLLCVITAFTIIGVLTIARAAFATQGGSIDDLLSGIQGNLDNLGPIGALTAALADTSALVLACINFGGIITTFVLAFFSHDSDRDYDHAQTHVERHEKTMAKIHKAYLKERAKVVGKYAPDLVGFASLYNAANSKVIESKTRLGAGLDNMDHFVITDLDQMAEDAERAEEAVGYSAHPGVGAPRREPGMAEVIDLPRSTGTDGR